MASGSAGGAQVAQMVNMKYGRDDELKPDYLGVRFMADADYDSRAMIGVMKMLVAASSGESFVFGRGDDIHWMAGYDRYWTIRNRVGDAVATLLVRQLAFDLSEVPERSSDRQEGLRSGIGNLRRSAEKLFDQSWSESKDGTGTVPFFPVLCPE